MVKTSELVVEISVLSLVAPLIHILHTETHAHTHTHTHPEDLLSQAQSVIAFAADPAPTPDMSEASRSDYFQ